MTWEYETAEIPRTMLAGRLDAKTLLTILDKHGSQGWELVTLLDNYPTGLIAGPLLAVYKRAKSEG